MAFSKRRWPWLVLMGVAVVLTALFVYPHDPEQTAWSPKCPMLLLTGYKCPGCGIQRFVYHLAHGHLLTAVRYNYFAAALSPYLLLLASGEVAPWAKWRDTVRRHLANRFFAYTYIALYFAWWVVRNILGL